MQQWECKGRRERRKNQRLNFPGAAGWGDRQGEGPMKGWEEAGDAFGARVVDKEVTKEAGKDLELHPRPAAWKPQVGQEGEKGRGEEEGESASAH